MTNPTVRFSLLPFAFALCACGGANPTDFPYIANDAAPPLAMAEPDAGTPSTTPVTVQPPLDAGVVAPDAGGMVDVPDAGDASDPIDASAPDASDAYAPPAQCVPVAYNTSVMPSACSVGTAWGCEALAPDGGRYNYGACPQYSSGFFQVALPDGDVLTIGPSNGNGVLVCCPQGIAGPP